MHYCVGPRPALDRVLAAVQCQQRDIRTRHPVLACAPIVGTPRSWNLRDMRGWKVMCVCDRELCPSRLREQIKQARGWWHSYIRSSLHPSPVNCSRAESKCPTSRRNAQFQQCGVVSSRNLDGSDPPHDSREIRYEERQPSKLRAHPSLIHHNLAGPLIETAGVVHQRPALRRLVALHIALALLPRQRADDLERKLPPLPLPRPLAAG